MIIKKWNTSTTNWEALSPKVTYTDIVADVTAGTPTSIFDGGKLLASYLPDFVFGGMQFEDTIPTNIGYSTMADRLHAAWLEFGMDSLNGLKGKYFIAEGNLTLQTPTSSQQKGAGTTANPTKFYKYALLNHELEEDHPGSQDIDLEHGDWLVVVSVTGTGADTNNPYIFNFAVVNNTYQLATSSSGGIIKIGYSENGKNYPVELASGKAYVNVPWVDTNTFRTITAGGNTLGASETLAFTAGTNVSISESGGAVTISSTDTNYSAGNGIGLTGTTFSVAAGGGLSQDANGLSHADTSSQASSSNSGRTYIQSIVLDTYGHITSISTATETVTNTTYSAGNGISLSGTTFSVAGGQGLTQESSGLKMTYPVYHGDTLPTLTSSSEYSNVIGFEW